MNTLERIQTLTKKIFLSLIPTSNNWRVAMATKIIGVTNRGGHYLLKVSDFKNYNPSMWMGRTPQKLTAVHFGCPISPDVTFLFLNPQQSLIFWILVFKVGDIFPHPASIRLDCCSCETAIAPRDTDIWMINRSSMIIIYCSIS